MVSNDKISNISILEEKMVLAAGMSSALRDCLELAGLVITFIFILVLAYYATQWVAKSTTLQNKNKNIRMIETYRVNQNKYVQILKIGNKFIAIGVGKDEVNFLSELPPESIKWEEEPGHPMPDFKDVLEKMNEKRKKLQKTKKDRS